MSKFVTRFMNDESGETAIEYGLLAAGIGIVILTGIGVVATALNANFTAVSAAL